MRLLFALFLSIYLLTLQPRITINKECFIPDNKSGAEKNEYNRFATNKKTVIRFIEGE